MQHPYWRPTLLLAFAWLSATSGAAQEPAASQPPLALEQRQFIHAFSGASASQGQTMPAARSTYRERAAAADFLMKELKRRGLPAQRHHYQRSNVHFTLDLLMPPIQGQNIVSHVPATIETDEYVIVGAHYDSVPGSPGADDNATGVAAVLSVASAMWALTNRRVHFLAVFFDQEEDDSPGSQSFAEKIQAEGLRVHSMHNVDMIGWDSDDDRAVEMELPTPELRAVYLAAAEARGIKVTQVRYNSSDHIPFRDVGIPAVCLSERFGAGDSSPHRHTSGDAVGAVNFEFAASSTQLMIDAMTSLAVEP